MEDAAKSMVFEDDEDDNDGEYGEEEKLLPKTGSNRIPKERSTKIQRALDESKEERKCVVETEDRLLLLVGLFCI